MLGLTHRNGIDWGPFEGQLSPEARSDIAGATRGRWLRRGALRLALASAIIAGALAAGPAFAAKKAPPIAEPMYLSAYANLVTRNPANAVKPLTHLVVADPGMADIQNALALALFTVDPDQHEIAFQHAERAVALAPDKPQFVVTYVLTNRSQWKIEADGTARLTRAAALRLNEAMAELLDMSGNAKKLGKLLRSVEETGGDPDFPFVFADYKTLTEKPSLALTRPDTDEFNVAQKAIEEKIFALRQKLEENKAVATEESREANERKADIEAQVAEAAERQKAVEEAKIRALDKLQAAAAETALGAKQVAELERQRQLMAEVEERRIAEERRTAEERRLVDEKQFAEAQALLAEQKRIAEEQAQTEVLARLKAEEERLAEDRRLAEEARIAEEKRIAEAEAERKAEEEARIVEEKRKAIAAEDAARKAREELALIAKAAEEARREQEALELAQQLAREQAEEADRKKREAEEAAKATMEDLLKQIAEQQKLLEAMLDTEPPLIKVVAAPESFELGEGSYQIAGVVGDMGGPPRRLTINGERVPLFRLSDESQKIADHTMAFRLDVTPTDENDQTFVIEAFDAADNKTTETVVIKITVANRPNIQGKNYALIIGSNDYDYLPQLKTAVGDAEAIAEVLERKYDFDEGAVKLLTNATRREILGALSSFRRSLNAEDRLLIYYAGHGQIDPATDEGFWQPVDAEPESDFTWVSNADVKRYLGGMPAKHILVIADSCFSGSLTRGAETQNENEDKFFLNIDKYPSRKVISSGGTEPVADAGSGGHSVFAYFLIKALEENTKPYITSFQLYDRLVRAVTNNSNQTPEYGTVPDSGDQGSGDFTFIRRASSG